MYTSRLTKRPNGRWYENYTDNYKKNHQNKDCQDTPTRVRKNKTQLKTKVASPRQNAEVKCKQTKQKLYDSTDEFPDP